MRERTWTLVGCRQREKRARVPVGRGTRRDVGDVARVGSLLEHFAPLDDDGARRPREELGRAAVELLLDEIEHPKTHHHRQVVFQPELVIRASSDVSVRKQRRSARTTKTASRRVTR